MIDLPNDHTYGAMKVSKSQSKFDEIIKNKYASDEKPELLMNVEKVYKP